MSQSLKRIAIGAVFALAAVPVLAQPPQGGGQYGGQGGGRGGNPSQSQPQAPTPAPVQTQPQYQPPGPPQSNDTLTVYAQPFFAGQSATYSNGADRTPSGVIFGSIKVRGAWQLCSGANFSGACVTVDRDTTLIQATGLRSVGSFRPMRGNGNPGPMPPPPPPERGDNASLRGINATFYPRPAERGLRVQVGDDDRGGGRPPYGRPGFDRPAPTPSDQDVRNEASRFCRVTGLTQVRNYSVEQVNRRFYLADVLCTKN